MRLPRADLLRAAIIGCTNAVIPMLQIFNVISWTPDQTAMAMLSISSVLTLLFLFYPPPTPGTEPEPEPEELDYEDELMLQGRKLVP